MFNILDPKHPFYELPQSVQQFGRLIATSGVYTSKQLCSLLHDYDENPYSPSLLPIICKNAGDNEMMQGTFYSSPITDSTNQTIIRKEIFDACNILTHYSRMEPHYAAFFYEQCKDVTTRADVPLGKPDTTYFWIGIIYYYDFIHFRLDN